MCTVFMIDLLSIIYIKVNDSSWWSDSPKDRPLNGSNLNDTFEDYRDRSVAEVSSVNFECIATQIAVNLTNDDDPSTQIKP